MSFQRWLVRWQESMGDERLGFEIAINHITNNEKQEAIIVNNLTPKAPEKSTLLRKVISPTMGGWS